MVLSRRSAVVWAAAIASACTIEIDRTPPSGTLSYRPVTSPTASNGTIAPRPIGTPTASTGQPPAVPPAPTGPGTATPIGSSRPLSASVDVVPLEPLESVDGQ